MIGETLSHFRILEKIAQGGMGVVYRAQDTRLGRIVAIKVLRPESMGDPERKRRFVQEARTASALNHPNIVTIHDIDTAGGVDFIAMEQVEGRSLDAVAGGRPLPLNEALHYGVQIAGALGAAHAAGIVHRDVKPANVMVSDQGLVKVLDFGLAKLTESTPTDEDSPTNSLPPRTEEGTILGTVAYMSPEQAEGKPVDARSDVFSLGAVLYEMAAGERPFRGDSRLSTLAAIIRDAAPPIRIRRPDAPPEFERVVSRCLEKDRDARYASGSEVAAALERCRSLLAPDRGGLVRRLRRPRVALALLGAALAVTTALVWQRSRGAELRWARQTALPEIARLVEQDRHSEALRLARKAAPYLPDDTPLRQLLRNVSLTVSIRTEPEGAEVYIKDYVALDQDWELLGRAPLPSVSVPLGQLRWRIIKEGHETSERAGLFPVGEQVFALDPVGAAPAGMVHVPRGSFRFGGTFQLDDYWMDRHEVTHREFKAFVDAGAYERRDLWKHPFLRDGRTLSWEEAIREFRDATGRPGPSTWQLGTYPEGQGNHPVGGVSWYEAAAYAEFAGRSLPTVYHWFRAAQGAGIFSDIMNLSNFGAQGPAPVGRHQGLSPFGSYDMAGNIAEWCWNTVGDRRFVLGGSWSDASYMFYRENAQPPMSRPANYGFRSVFYPVAPPEALLGPVERLGRDYAREKPVGDDVFRVFAGLYAYPQTELNATVESVEESDHWHKERVSLDAAYGGERVVAYLFLPRGASPPYQTVVYFPTSVSLVTGSIDSAEMLYVDFLVKGGRAVLYPVYKGMYERRLKGVEVTGVLLERELVIPWSKDLGRALDYLETRAEIDHGRLAYYGFSLGGRYGPVLTAVEPRLKASILLAGGLMLDDLAEEVDPKNFAPRARAPVLMLNGRDDFMRPVEASQLPLFRLLGARSEDKRHVLFDSGHAPPRIPVIKEILDWLDRYLGPVRMRKPG